MDKKVMVDGETMWSGRVLRDVTVRPATRDEEARWKALIVEHHYLGLDHLVGETVKHVAEVDGHWVALVGWCSAALKVTVREQWIGWNPQQKQRRLKYVAQNGRFLMLPGAGEIPNLASRVLALSVRRVPEDFLRVYGHRVVLAETFVDGSRFAGTCYRAAGWECLGETQGYGKHASRYIEHGQPKQVWVRALFREARQWLRAPFDTPVLVGEEALACVDINRVPLQGQDGLLAAMAKVPDRRQPSGKRHELAFILTVAACGALAGRRGYRQVAEYAANLPQEALRRLGARPRHSTGQLLPPSEPTIRRTMQEVDIAAFERELSAFQLRLGLSKALALDGKTLRGSAQQGRKPQHLLAVVTHGSQRTVAQVAVGEKTNEIPEAPPLLGTLDLRGRVVTADALHAQRELAQFVVERGGEYVLTVKDNQPTMRKLLAAQDWSAFPPSQRSGQGARADRDPHDPGHPACQGSALPACGAGVSLRAHDHIEQR